MYVEFLQNSCISLLFHIFHTLWNTSCEDLTSKIY